MKERLVICHALLSSLCFVVSPRSWILVCLIFTTALMQLESAFRDLENVCPPDIDRSPTSLYYKVLKLLKIQIVLRYLRQESPAVDEFEKCVKLLFRTSRGKVPVVETAIVDTYNELIAVTDKKISSAHQSKLIDGLLQKYGREQFLQTFDEFVRLNQPQAMLDSVLADIESDIYVPRSAAVASASDAAEVLPDQVVSTKVGANIKPDDTSSRLRAPKTGRGTAMGQADAGPRVQLSAWQLRKGLGMADDEEEWTAVHQVLRSRNLLHLNLFKIQDPCCRWEKLAFSLCVEATASQNRVNVNIAVADGKS
jgi:hypothetical protein